MNICIIGTGTMGSGIAQTFAQGGHNVLMKDLSEELLKRAVSMIDKNLSYLVAKEKISETDKSAALSKIHTTLSYDDCRDCDLIVEAIAENMELKKLVFKELDSICKSETIFATNSSSLSITEIASCTNRPDRVIGMHFFNPVPVMKLVEVIKGQLTTDSTSAKIFEIAESLGKTPIFVNEAPGFVVNRILVPMINEAIGVLADGVASATEIDTAMKLGSNQPIGPLALGDLIGLDVCLAIMEVLYSEYGDSKYRPHPLLRKMVRANLLGRKSGKGFFSYNK